MKEIKEAVIDCYHFTLSDDYFVVTKEGGRGELVHLKPEEARDLTLWLMREFKLNTLPPSRSIEKAEKVYPSAPSMEVALHWGDTVGKEEVVYDPGNRSFEGTEALPPLMKHGGNAGITKMGPDTITLKGS